MANEIVWTTCPLCDAPESVRSDIARKVCWRCHTSPAPLPAEHVAALFVEPNGSYAGVPGIDMWPEERDARKYNGTQPVVAHPPCHLWVNMAAVNWKRYGRQRPAWYPGGDDGGCFEAALATIKRVGGVLEHPASSHAFKEFGIEQPSGYGWEYRGTAVTGQIRMRNTLHVWVCEVWQSAYGHKARKRTWLIYCGERPPFALRWDRKPGTHQVGWFDRNKPTLSKKEAIATPPAFRDELIKLAQWSRKQ